MEAKNVGSENLALRELWKERETEREKKKIMIYKQRNNKIHRHTQRKHVTKHTKENKTKK